MNLEDTTSEDEMAGTEELFNEGTDRWENVLEALLAFVGREVAIGVMGGEDNRPIAHIQGTFSTAYEMPAGGKSSVNPSEDDDAFKITLMRRRNRRFIRHYTGQLQVRAAQHARRCSRARYAACADLHSAAVGLPLVPNYR